MSLRCPPAEVNLSTGNGMNEMGGAPLEMGGRFARFAHQDISNAVLSLRGLLFFLFAFLFFLSLLPFYF